jgi:hypothetical protein
MKALKVINTIAIGLPFLLLIIGLLINDSAGNYIAYALYSTMITGFIQVILGLILLIINPKNLYFIGYILIVVLFFSLWYFNMNIYYSDILSAILFPVPLLLAIYLSILIYKRQRI